MAPHDQDPNRIDVSLNIMSDATLQAVNNLTNQLSNLRDFIAAQGSAQNPAGAASQAAGLWVPPSAYTPGQIPIGGASAPPLTGERPNPSDQARVSRQRYHELQAEYQAYITSVKGGGIPSNLSEDAENLMATQLSDIQRMRLARAEKRNPNVRRVSSFGSAMDRFFELYPGTERNPREDDTYRGVVGQEFGGNLGLPEGMGSAGQGGSYPTRGPGTTSPMAQYGDMPGWAQGLANEGITPESRFGLTLPRLGEFTIQDKLDMVARYMGRSAMRGGTYNPDTDQMEFGRGATLRGRTAATAAYMRDQSAAIATIGQEFQRIRGFAAGEEMAGEALGFSRESALGDIELFGVGGRLNFGITSAAQREALRQELTQRRVQAAPGVSGEEAQRIRNVVAGMGWSGDTNARMQWDLFRPITQRYGASASEAFAPLVDQGLRQGNSSIAALRDTMLDLADAARNANMSVDDVANATLEYAESVQEVGANYESALRNAATFTRSGLDPRLASQAMQSPIVQGNLMIQTGLPPQLQGIIGAPGVMQGMARSIEQGLALGSAYQNLPDATMETASGKRIVTATGRDAQIAMAAQTTGLPRQIIERYMRNPDFLRAGGVAQTMVGQLQDEIRGATHEERTIPGHWEATTGGPRLRGGRGGPTGRTWVPPTTEAAHRNLSEDQRQALEHSTSPGMMSYDDLEQQMIAMDPKNKAWTDRVKKIRGDHGKIEDRIKVAQRIIGEATNVKPEPDYMVGLTPEAAKILKIVKPKDRQGALPRANSGGVPANASMMGPGYPSTEGGASMMGLPGGP